MWRRNVIKLSLFYFLSLWNFCNQCATKSNEITHCSRVMMHSCRACSMHPLLSGRPYLTRIQQSYFMIGRHVWLPFSSDANSVLLHVRLQRCYSVGAKQYILQQEKYQAWCVREWKHSNVCLIRWMCETRGNFRMTRDWPETDTHVRSGFQNKGVHLRSRW